MISNLLLTAALAAHPLGNFSVNELVELIVRPDRIDAVAVVDLAELPTLQMTASCDDFAAALTLRVNGAAQPWTIQSRQLEQPEGAAGLKTTRITCNLTAPAKLGSAATIELENGYLPDRVGWNEITAGGDGVILQTDLPSRSATDRLRQYPSDPLSTPMQVRQVSFGTAPGVDAQRTAAAITENTSLLKRAETWLTTTIGDPTPLAGLLAVLLSVVLGAAHAALPGHGKTVIAVYMAGRKGRRRDALYVGATVTLTHTAGVLILGIGLTAVASLAAESVLAWLGIVSGAVMLAVGVGMLLSAVRQRRARALAAAHAQASASRWLEVARWHDLDHGLGIVRTDRTDRTRPNGDTPTSGNDHNSPIDAAPVDAAPVDHSEGPARANGLAHVDGRVRSDEPLHMDARVNVDGLVNVDSIDHMHATEHGHADDPEDEHGLTGHVPHRHDHGHGHHHHGHHHHHHEGHGHGHGHEHGHGYGFWGGHRHRHGLGGGRMNGHELDDDHEYGDEYSHRPEVVSGHDHGHEQGHRHGLWRNLWHGHSHDHAHGHSHEPVQGRASLTALGIAGGLVPSPTALVVLLGAVALGRTWFGILLTVAYGLGMAGTLTAAGLLLLRLRERWSWFSKLSIPPTATGSLIIALGLGLAARAVLTI